MPGYGIVDVTVLHRATPGRDHGPAPGESFQQTERILTQLRCEGYDIVDRYEAADLVVVNTCGFIDEAIDESLTTIGEALDENGLDSSAIDWLVPHQANKRIIDSTARKLGMETDKIVLTVQDHANTSAASIPLALDAARRDGRIKEGDLILMDVDREGVVAVELVGACGTCPLSVVTMTAGIEALFKQRVPGVTGVVARTPTVELPDYG